MELVQALISSGNVKNEDEANAIISDMRNQVFEGADPEELLYEYGLEPDYVMDLFDF